MADRDQSSLTLPLAGLFLILSGAASLIYQVTWVRLLGLSMGSTSASVSTVLAAFFVGLAAGSYLAERVTRTGNPVRRYLLLEAAIAGCGLMLLPVLLRLDMAMALIPGVGTELYAKFLVTVALLAVPTMCMGATFPVMAAILVRRRSDVGRRISHLYSLNTLGAVAGAWLSAFLIIPWVGLDGAIYAAVLLNVTVVILGLRSARAGASQNASAPEPAPASAAPVRPSRAARAAALLALVVTGFTSIAAEVGWTKFLSLLTGTTLYGFAGILVVFLSGIAAGAWLVRSRLERIADPRGTLGLALLSLAASVVVGRALLGFAPWAHGLATESGASGSLYTYGFIAAVLLPTTVLFGAAFPLALSVYCGDAEGVRSGAGKAYAANTFAGIAGSVAAGFWLIPRYGTDALLGIVAVILSAAAAILLLGGARPMVRRTGPLAALAVAASVAIVPGLDYRPLIDSVDDRFDPLRGQRTAPPEFVYLHEGRGGVISVVTYDGQRAALQNNGLTESHLDLFDPRNASLSESLLGLIPYFVHRDPRTAFIVGFGGGNTAYALSTTFALRRIDVVELEESIIEAVKTATSGVPPAMRDPRVQVEIGDARNRLLLGEQRYDLIVSQPSHPWLSGAGSMFTQEFFTIARSRLEAGGVFAQWLNLFRMDVTTLRSIVAALYRTFPHGMIFVDRSGYELVLLGSPARINLDVDRIAERMHWPATATLLRPYAMRGPLDLLDLFGFSRERALELAGAATPNTDTNLISEVRLAALRSAPSAQEDPVAFVARSRGLDLGPYLPPEQALDAIRELESRRGRGAGANPGD